MTSLAHLAAALIFAPLLPGIINRTKAVVGGRRGQPLLQLYHDIFKLMMKGGAFSKTTTWVFRAGPAISLCATLIVAALVPFGGSAAPLNFSGDFILFAYLLGLGRFMTVLAALDTGSAFEGMGASREMQFGALAELGLFLAMACLALIAGSLSLFGMLSAPGAELWGSSGPAAALVVASLFVLMLAENARIPVDDPNTHLELTMIHEVMVLDHGGPDLAFISYGSALKLWIFSAVIVGVAVPVPAGNQLEGTAIHLCAIAVIAVLVGLVESAMARLKLLRVPQLLVGAAALSLVAFTITFLMR